MLSKLNTNISMRMQHGCGGMPEKTVLLNKSLYGLKQAARAWHNLLVSTLRSKGFEEHPHELNIFRLPSLDSDTVKIIIAVRVDDMIVAGSDENCTWPRGVLSKLFAINNIEPLISYTRCAFGSDRDNGTVGVHQTVFIHGVAETISMTSPRSAPDYSANDLRAKTEEEQAGN